MWSYGGANEAWIVARVSHPDRTPRWRFERRPSR